MGHDNCKSFIVVVIITATVIITFIIFTEALFKVIGPWPLIFCFTVLSSIQLSLNISPLFSNTSLRVLFPPFLSLSFGHLPFTYFVIVFCITLSVLMILARPYHFSYFSTNSQIFLATPPMSLVVSFPILSLPISLHFLAEMLLPLPTICTPHNNHRLCQSIVQFEFDSHAYAPWIAFIFSAKPL